MKPQKIDRRVRRTKKLLLQGLTQLMSEKKINKITVKELTDLVDINRATFYLYYKDIFDMVDKIESDMFEDFSEAFKKFSKETATYDNMLSFFTYVFEFVKDNSSMFKILLGPDGDYSFIEKFKKVIKNDHPPFDSTKMRIEAYYFTPFVTSGCIGAIQQWLEDDMETCPKEMAIFVTELILNCGKLCKK